jgi:hypothetical protein
MRKLLIFLAAVTAGATVAGAGQDRWSRAEREYHALVDGKVAGKPVSCIDTRFTKPSLSAYRDKLIYRVDRNLVYVNDTGGGCQNVARGDALVTQRFQPQACRGDIAQTVNLPTGIYSGSCALGDFVPYRTAK